MIKPIITLFLLMATVSPANSEVFKCKLVSGQIAYQSEPCPSSTVQQKIVEIKELTPEQLKEAQKKLQAWQDYEAAEEADKIRAAKEQQEEIDRQETINALNRDAIARQQQAIATQRQAEALERQRLQYNNIYAFPPARY